MTTEHTLILVLSGLCIATAIRLAVLSDRLARFRRLAQLIGVNLYTHASVRRVLGIDRDWVRQGHNVYDGDDYGSLVCEAASPGDAERIVQTVNTLKSVHNCIRSSGCLRVVTAD